MKDKEKQNISMKEMLTKRSFEPITNCNCRKEKDGAFVDLLNQEIEELQKETAEKYKGFIRELLTNGNDSITTYYGDVKYRLIREDDLQELAKSLGVEIK